MVKKAKAKPAAKKTVAKKAAPKKAVAKKPAAKLSPKAAAKYAQPGAPWWKRTPLPS